MASVDLIDNLRTNPLGLNVVIGLLGVSIAWNLAGLSRSPFSIVSVAVASGLVIGFLRRKEWARIATSVIASLLLIVSPVLFIADLRITLLAQPAAYLLVVWLLWTPKVRAAFSENGVPKPLTGKTVFFLAVLPVLAVVSILGAGGYFLGRAFTNSLLVELPGNHTKLDLKENDLVGRKLLQGELLSKVSKVIFVSHPVEVDSATGKPGIINSFLELSQMPQSALPLAQASRLLSDMAAHSREYNVLLSKESRQKQKMTGKTWYQLETDYPDYNLWATFFLHKHNIPKKGFDGSLIVFLKNDRIGRIYLRNYGDSGTMYYWVGRDEPVPDVKPMGGTMAMTDLILTALSQAAMPPPDILYPDLSSEEANKSAAQRIGPAYQQAMDYLGRSKVLVEHIGKIEDIRPATGTNEAGGWMDFSATLSFLVRGDKKTALAQVKHNDSWISGALYKGKEEFSLETAYQAAPLMAADFLERSVNLALILGKPTSILLNGACGPFYTQCNFDVEGAKGKGSVAMDIGNKVTGKVVAADKSFPLEKRLTGQSWGPKVVELDMSRELVAYVDPIGSYSHTKQKNLKEVAFGFSVNGSVQNVSKQTQSLFLESRNYYQHWKGKSVGVTTGVWPYRPDQGIIRVDLKPGEIYTMQFPLMLSPDIRPRLRSGSIAHIEQLFRLEFTPLYSRIVNGKTESVKDFGSFNTPEFGIVVEE